MTVVVSRGQTISVSLMSEQESDNEGSSMTTTSGCPACFNGACPEITPVTVVATTVTLSSGAAVELEWAAASDTAGALTINFNDSDGDLVDAAFAFGLRFVDSALVTDRPSSVAPTKPGFTFALLHADGGTREVEVEYAGPRRTWYPVVEFGGSVVVGAAVTLGV